MKRFLTLLAAALLLFTLCACAASAPAPAPTAQPTPTPTPTPTPEPTPEPEPTPAFEPEFRFTATDRDGKTWDESAFAGSKLTMINLWEPWCGPCVAEMPDLEKLWQDYRDSGVQILGVYRETGMEDEVDAVIAQTGVSYPILHLEDGLTEFETGFVPTTLFVDGEGRVLRHEPDPAVLSMFRSDGIENAEEVAGAVVIGSRSYAAWEAFVQQKLQ